MAAKAAVETMTKAFTEAVLENPSRTITAAAGVIVWALGTTVAVNRESVQKQLDRDSEAEQRQQDRDSQAEQRQQDRDSQAEQRQQDRDSQAEQKQQDRDSQAEQRQQSRTDIHKKL